MNYLLVLILLVIGCDSTSIQSIDSDEFRKLNMDERYIYEETVRCFVDTGVEPFNSMGFTEPLIRVSKETYKPDDSNFDSCAGIQHYACAFLGKNTFTIRVDKYYNGNDPTGLNSKDIVHEIKHLLLYQAGENPSHENVWFRWKDAYFLFLDAEGFNPCYDFFIEYGWNIVIEGEDKWQKKAG